jgi:hypothetical protein
MARSFVELLNALYIIATRAEMMRWLVEGSICEGNATLLKELTAIINESALTSEEFAMVRNSVEKEGLDKAIENYPVEWRQQGNRLRPVAIADREGAEYE